MATIEPRLIHLLNESTATPRPHHAELPPIKGLSLPKASGRPHPIEPDAGRRSDGTADTNGGQLAAQQQPRPSLYPVGDEGSASTTGQRREPSGYTTDRTLHHISSQDLRMILDDTPTLDCSEDLTTKKRPSKEDFVQLPQPLKKQKSGTQQHIFPPIIVGLLEPPLNAALFPPISSGSFDDRPHSEPSQALNITKSPEIQNGPEDSNSHRPAPSPSPEADKTPTGKAKRRAAKPRRKWSEEETNHLLKGVSKHGVGRWTDILADKEYNFNERSAGDLKDRFRTCCPEELRANLMAKKEAAKEKQAAMMSENKPRKGLMSENILNEPEEDVDMERAQSVQNDSDSGAPKQRKSRAHRKKLEDLAELGIKGPFKKSHRRERRPFSEQDDREILEGFELYGPQWTKIQRDPRFNLSSRQPTDLRDRLRNKYPERFASTEKTAMQVKEQSGPGSSGPGPSPNNNLLEPSVNMAIGNSLNNVSVTKSALLEPHQLNRTNSKDDVPRWSLLPPSSVSLNAEQSRDSSSTHTHTHTHAHTHAHVAASGFYWSEGVGGALASGAIGEMDISRLLLDDTQITGDQPSDKRGQG
ncbi:hypothetical protein SLS62_005454 [Diatrype stigma]|uniref:Uncharacterized protein n=1 Tax=Diatrype stigma TaxID=117547 RepID=A0AAN9UR57_9PEZI